MRLSRRPSRRRIEGIALNLVSMIDVTFLMLIYFMATMVLAKPEDRLSPSLQTQSQSAAGPTADFQPQLVDVLLIDGAPAYRLGEKVLRQKVDLLTALERLYKPAGLFVRAADDAQVGFVAGAIQAARDAGFEQVTYVPAQ
ncbi:MAG: ExbD/TolR family protein [Planctomycetota bacterium]|jgi:biopolymer transport protein ExbD